MSDWQSAPARNNKHKSVFVGNLNNKPDIEEKLRALFSRSAVAIHGLEIVPLKKPNTKCYALVKCDVGMAIKCLNGIQFDGIILSVKTDKEQNHARKKGMGFGGGWATPSVGSAPAKPASTNRNVSQERPAAASSEKSSLDPSPETKAAGLSCDTLLSASMDEINLDANANANTAKSSMDPDDVSNFRARCKISLNNLMEEYGAFDPDYEKMNIQEIKTSSHENSNSNNNAQQPVQNSGMLAPNGKAPIHIEIVSFGFKYSVPPQAREGWSHSNPLSPIDCRDLPRCPHHVAKLSGLSFKVKRAMLYMTKERYSDNEDDDSDGEEEVVKGRNPLLAKSEEVSKTILGAVEEAINDAGHGYAFPLETSVHVGSEYGRHRSVVLCENLAQQIRALLRANEGGRITQPVSVSTRHRDVDQKHRDEEAFGTDMRKAHQAEVKRKNKEERLEGRFDSRW